MGLVLLWRRWWRRPVSVAATESSDEDGSRWYARRARFWRELRDGQREAEEQKAASLDRHGIREE
jgi:hypothetical protein